MAITEVEPAGVPRVYLLYRMYDEDDNLLYVGMSGRLLTRLDNHWITKPWLRDLRKITVRQYPSQEKGLQAETQAIRREVPRYNRVHHPRRVLMPRSVPVKGVVRTWKVTFEPEEFDSVEQAARASGRGVSGYIRVALRDYMRRHR